MNEINDVHKKLRSELQLMRKLQAELDGSIIDELENRAAKIEILEKEIDELRAKLCTPDHLDPVQVPEQTK